MLISYDAIVTLSHLRCTFTSVCFFSCDACLHDFLVILDDDKNDASGVPFLIRSKIEIDNETSLITLHSECMTSVCLVPFPVENQKGIFVFSFR